MIQEILQYQDIDKNLRKIETELANSEERKRALSAKNFLMESEENVGKIDRRAEELLNQFKKAKENYESSVLLIKEYDATIKTLKSEDEILYLSKKVNQLLEGIKNLEKDIATISKDMEDVAKTFNDFRQKYKAATAEYNENKEKFDILRKSKADSMNAIKAKLDEVAKKIDASVLEKYNRKRNDRIFPVLVPARDTMCGGCSMEIPLKEMDKLKANKIIECEHCRRMIYTT